MYHSFFFYYYPRIKLILGISNIYIILGCFILGGLALVFRHYKSTHALKCPNCAAHGGGRHEFYQVNPAWMLSSVLKIYTNVVFWKFTFSL